VLEKHLSSDVSLRDLMSLDLHELSKERGFARQASFRIEAICELYRRWSAMAVKEGVKVETPEEIAGIYIPMLKDLQHEEFHVVSLDNSGGIISDFMVSKGIVNAALVHPREVFKAAINAGATYIVLVHNHPSGTREASAEDHRITKQLVAAGHTIDIPVRDHLIICGNSYVSFAENGWLA